MPQQPAALDRFLVSAVQEIERLQEDDGSFLLYSSTDLTHPRAARRAHTPFLTALILTSLRPVVGVTAATPLIQKGCALLRGQFSEHGSVNYWLRGAAEVAEVPYPDDLDDTFCALAALTAWEPAYVTGEVMAHMVRLLTTLEVREGGPYRTWLVPPESDEVWRDVDVVVNANVGYFLKQHEVTLEGVDQLIDTTIAGGDFHSPYYAPTYPVLYFLSRYVAREGSEGLRDAILALRDVSGEWGNPLHTALMISSLLQLGVSPAELAESVSWLVAQITEEGWRPYAFITDVAEGEKRSEMTFVGSPALTAAFCAEAVARYQEALRVSEEHPTALSGGEEDVYGAVQLLVQQRLASLPEPLQEQVADMVAYIVARDTDHQVGLLPYWSAQSFRIAPLPDSFLTALGAATLYGWVAYTIYDDFFDDEGELLRLSAANTCLRELTTLFTQRVEEALPGSGFSLCFHRVMDMVDNATTWELNHCRVGASVFTPEGVHALWHMPLPSFDDYEMLAQKSLGHALGPLAVLFASGYTETSPEVGGVLRFFKHYLIARQLNDDMHDWEEDLGRGHLNAVGAHLLHACRGRGDVTCTPQSLQEAVLV